MIKAPFGGFNHSDIGMDRSTLRGSSRCKGSDDSLYCGYPLAVYMNAKDPRPSQELHSRAALAPVFADLNKYVATMHFVGRSTILSLTPDRGTGETYCLAHPLTIEGEKRQLMVAVLRYYDTFVRVDGTWLFAERLLYVDWIEERVLS